ncbi:MAG TPA: hypothetical protein ENN19_18315 [Chloroflexi bacterium]|nr:hypothetical protein [Chloroflexota bacterium]
MYLHSDGALKRVVFCENGNGAGENGSQVVLLDNSVIVDGRVADVARTSFIKGKMVTPRFVLEELQRLADSADDLKRARGRHALELLRELQADDLVRVDDAPGGSDDHRLQSPAGGRIAGRARAQPQCVGQRRQDPGAAR